MNQQETDTYYLEIAKAVSKRSTCCYGNLGCVIVDKDDNIISASCLEDKSGILDCRSCGYCSFAARTGTKINFGTPEHCDYMFPEVNAILTADRVRLQGATLYLLIEDLKGRAVTPKLEQTVLKVIRSAGIQRIVLQDKES